VEFLVFEISIVYILVLHDKSSKDSLIVVPGTFKPGAIWPNHCSLAIPLIKLPLAIKFCCFIAQNIVIILCYVHLPRTISLAANEEASVDISILILGRPIAIDTAMQEVPIVVTGSILLGPEDGPFFILILTLDELVVLKDPDSMRCLTE
jgi:hypothetical protein